MCDYSLHGIRNRLAKQGEVLIVHQFQTGSKGLTSPEYRKANPQPHGLLSALKRLLAIEPEVCAVCIPDGAKLTLHGISPKLQETHGLNSDEAVTFRQLSLNVHTYRDAVEFRNGVRIRLQELEDGQLVEVVALSPEMAEVQEQPLTFHV
jgi:hypothetical protein